MNTIDDRIRVVGVSRGFDYLRISLAVGVLCWHSVFVSGNDVAVDAVLHGWLGPLKALILPMFFH